MTSPINAVYFHERLRRMCGHTEREVGRSAIAHEPLLTKEESAALRMLATAGLMKKAIPPRTMEKLLALKFVEQKAGGLTVTEKGTEILDRYSR